MSSGDPHCQHGCAGLCLHMMGVPHKVDGPQSYAQLPSKIYQDLYAEACIGYDAAKRETEQLRDALAHERDRARRVVRVFWRVRIQENGQRAQFTTRRMAWDWAKGGRLTAKVYRVTVRRVAKKVRT